MKTNTTVLKTDALVASLQLFSICLTLKESLNTLVVISYMIFLLTVISKYVVSAYDHLHNAGSSSRNRKAVMDFPPST